MESKSLQSDARIRRVLIVAALSRLPYRVMHCCHALGIEVHLLGGAVSERLQTSRFCASFHRVATEVDGRRSEELANEINALTRRFGIDMILAGDAPSTRALIASRDLIEAPCFPMPELDQFDLLNDKWRFGAMCHALGIKHPLARLVEDKESLRKTLAEGGARFPVIAKPLNMDGGNGVMVLEADSWERQIAAIDYAPIILQDYIAGEDIGASVYCRDGRVTGFVAHHFDEQVYTTFDDAGVLDDIEKIVGPMKLNGVFNFDMRRAPDGGIWYLECNPRFYFKMALTMAMGLNFVALGLPGAEQDSGLKICPPGAKRFRLPNKRRFLLGLALPWKFELISVDALRYMIADPVPFWREYLYLDEDPAIQFDRGPQQEPSLPAPA
jgi:hypothetical protein